MNGYSLTSAWYNFKFENPDRVRHIHSDLYFYIIYLWNKLGKKEKIGLPTAMTMQSLSIGSYNTYKTALNDLIDFGFIILIKDAKNQYQSKVIAISKNDEATDKALDKAVVEATDETPDKATDTIDKLLIKNRVIKNTLFLDVVSFLNQATASEYKHTTKSTQGFISAREKDGYCLEDFKSVIACKAKEWLGTENERYLRPETLFGNKFEGYLNSTKISKPKESYYSINKTEVKPLENNEW